MAEYHYKQSDTDINDIYPFVVSYYLHLLICQKQYSVLQKYSYIYFQGRWARKSIGQQCMKFALDHVFCTIYIIVCTFYYAL